jgi:phosphoribosylamine-glycine ligase
MEHKALMAGDMGISTGETFTLMKYMKAKDCKLFQETLGKLTDILKKIDFVGDADANCIIDEKGAHFLEFTMRFGSPATSSQIAIHKTKWGEFLKACADKKDISFEYDPRWCIVAWLFTPPFPHSVGNLKVNENPKNKDEMKDLLEHRLSNTEDLVVDFKEKLTPEELNNVHLEYVYYKDGQIRLANSSGYVFTITGQGDTPKEAGEATAKLLKKILVPKGFYRNDFTSHYDRSKKDLIKWGYLQDDSTIEEQLAEKAKQEEKDKQIADITSKVKEDFDKKLADVKKAVKGIIYEN